MLAADMVEALARELCTARKTRTALRHFSQRYPRTTIDDGYAIQRAWVALELADGRTIKGRKSASHRARCRNPARSTSPTSHR